MEGTKKYSTRAILIAREMDYVLEDARLRGCSALSALQRTDSFAAMVAAKLQMDDAAAEAAELWDSWGRIDDPENPMWLPIDAGE